MTEEPRYAHDCDRCTFIVPVGKFDMYDCPATGSTVARYGDDGHEYLSGQDRQMIFNAANDQTLADQGGAYVEIIRTYADEDEVAAACSFYDAEGARTERELVPISADWDDLLEGRTRLDLAATAIRDAGATEDNGDWFSDPDGSYITNYATAERCETSAHPRGLTSTEVDTLAFLLTHGLEER